MTDDDDDGHEGADKMQNDVAAVVVIDERGKRGMESACTGKEWILVRTAAGFHRARNEPPNYAPDKCAPMKTKVYSELRASALHTFRHLPPKLVI